MLKKTNLTLCALPMLLALASCGESPDAPTTPDAGAADTATSDATAPESTSTETTASASPAGLFAAPELPPMAEMAAIAELEEGELVVVSTGEGEKRRLIAPETGYGVETDFGIVSVISEANGSGFTMDQRLTMVFRVLDVAPDGAYRVESRISDAGFGEDGAAAGVPEVQGIMLDQAMRSVIGMRAVSVHKANGEQVSVEFDIPANANPTMAESMKGSLSGSQFLVPETGLGEGASWYSKTVSALDDGGEELSYNSCTILTPMEMGIGYTQSTYLRTSAPSGAATSVSNSVVSGVMLPELGFPVPMETRALVTSGPEGAGSTVEVTMSAKDLKPL